MCKSCIEPRSNPESRFPPEVYPSRRCGQLSVFLAEMSLTETSIYSNCS